MNDDNQTNQDLNEADQPVAENTDAAPQNEQSDAGNAENADANTENASANGQTADANSDTAHANDDNADANPQTADANPPAMTDEEIRSALDSMSNDELLDLFAEQMMVDKGLRDEVDSEVFSVLKDDLKDRLAQQINRAILVQLPDDKLEQLEKDLDADTATADGFEQMVTDAGVDIEQTTHDVMLAFRNTYLGLPVEGAN